MNAYIYIIKPTRPEMLRTGLNDHERAAFEAHSKHLEELAAKGVLVVSGRVVSAENPIGIGIFYAGSEEEAQRIADSDPFVARGVVTATVSPFSIAAGAALKSS